MTWCVYCNNGSSPVEHAKREPVCNTGQMCKRHQDQLNKAWKRGELSRGKGGWTPNLRLVWARLGFKYETHRRLILASYGVLDIVKHPLTQEECLLWMDWTENRRVSMFSTYEPAPFATA